MIESFALADGAPSRGRVLVVDDEPELLRAMSRLLGKAGYQTIGTTETLQALALLSLRRFDAVVTDLRLPMPSGGVFASHVAELTPETPVVVVTGANDLYEVWDLLDGSRVDAVIPKTAMHVALPAAIARAIAGARNLAEGSDGARLVADGLVRALALRDVETEAHSRRVAAWTLMLMQHLGEPRETWLAAELGALLHDIGKIGVADAILRKPAPLTEAEWVEMRRHPEFGCVILSGIVALAGVCDVVRSHHEHWDGKGYPDGLAGDAIPAHARAFSLVDAYDAMTSDRPYRRGLPHVEAVAAIRTGAGTQFDPRVVDAFAEIPESEWRAVAHLFADHGGYGVPARPPRASPVGVRAGVEEAEREGPRQELVQAGRGHEPGEPRRQAERRIAEPGGKVVVTLVDPQPVGRDESLEERPGEETDMVREELVGVVRRIHDVDEPA
jgi:response regulator RpfG family c-di-GMP phosphodiesterase